MVNYWCDYINKEYKRDTFGYRTLEGLMTDIMSEMRKEDSDIVRFLITDRCNGTEPFTIENPKFKK